MGQMIASMTEKTLQNVRRDESFRWLGRRFVKVPVQKKCQEGASKFF